MEMPLEYAPPLAWHRRRIGLAVLLLIVLAGSYTLAVPQVRAFQARAAQRDAIRQQYAAHVSAAESLLSKNNPGEAASELIRAEFPVRLDAHLFCRSELDAFKNRLT